MLTLYIITAVVGGMLMLLSAFAGEHEHDGNELDARAGCRVGQLLA